MVKLLCGCCCEVYISILSKHIFRITESYGLERTFTSCVVQSSWITKQLEQAHGFDVILLIKLTHWQFTYPSYFALDFDTEERFERKRKYENFKEENF